MASESVKFSVEKLNDKNYSTWKYEMKLVLIDRDLFEYVSNKKPEKDVPANWDKNDKKAMAAIGLSVEKTQQQHIRKCATAYDAWNALKEFHQRNSLSVKLRLLRNLWNVKLPEGGNMSEHLHEIGGLIDELEDAGETLTNHLTVALILSSLPESYDTIITALENTKEADFSVEYVKGKLIDEWKRKCEDRGGSSDQALRTFHGNVDFNKRNLWKVRCYGCNQEGHLIRDCPKIVNKDDNEKQGSTEKASIARTGSAGAADFCFGVAGNDLGDWYLDSGATSHMTADLNFFEKLDPCFEKIEMADGRKMLVKGRGFGNVSSGSTTVRMKNVLYTPGLKCNLMSVSKITDAGLGVNFQKDRCEILEDGQTIMSGVRDGNLYRMNIESQSMKPRYEFKKKIEQNITIKGSNTGWGRNVKIN